MSREEVDTGVDKGQGKDKEGDIGGSFALGVVEEFGNFHQRIGEVVQEHDGNAESDRIPTQVSTSQQCTGSRRKA